MVDVDPPYRCDPFQNIVKVHWEEGTAPLGHTGSFIIPYQAMYGTYLWFVWTYPVSPGGDTTLSVIFADRIRRDNLDGYILRYTSDWAEIDYWYASHNGYTGGYPPTDAVKLAMTEEMTSIRSRQDTFNAGSTFPSSGTGISISETITV